MSDSPRRGTVAAMLLVLVAGCGAAPAQDLAAAPSTPVAAAQELDDAACAAHAGTTDTVRAIAGAAADGPVVPAGVALFLFDARTRAAQPGFSDPALAAAQAELVAAIDDLDAQGWAGLPPGGNPGQDLVALDTARIVAAVEAVGRACAARAGVAPATAT